MGMENIIDFIENKQESKKIEEKVNFLFKKLNFDKKIKTMIEDELITTNGDKQEEIFKSTYDWIKNNIPNEFYLEIKDDIHQLIVDYVNKYNEYIK